MEAKVAEFIQFLTRQMPGNLGIAEQLRFEVGLAVTGVFRLPGLHGVALDQFVGFLASVKGSVL